MKIREVIERHGMTMADLAKKRGQTNSAVVQLVKGNPTMSKLRELAQDVGCNFWEFLEDEIEAAGFEVVKKGAATAPRSANMDACPSKNPAPTGVGSQGAEEQPSAGGQQASDGERPDLITIDPVTGESRKYKLIE